jgi:hypothetical protein
MALRDWHGWQIGMLWGLGLGALWVIGRVADMMTRPLAGQSRGIGGQLALTGLTLVIVMVLLVITVRWLRARLLDE